MSEPSFGEAPSGTVRVGATVIVRRQLNDYSPLEEVFEFSLTEPPVDAADREPFPTISYKLTREDRNGIPGCDDDEYHTRMMKPTDVPGEVIARAEAMVDWLEISPDLEDDDE